jgi:cyclopropane-fatty-acyl-phospholipid synthase
MHLAKSIAERLLGMADVGLDGRRPWDLVVHDPAFYRRALVEGSLGLGESYVAGQWDCADLEGLVFRLVRSGVERQARFHPTRMAGEALARLVNLQPRSLARRTAEHYDTDNELFAEILGKHKLYSCGYYAEGDDLDAAQHRKLDAICEGLALEPSDRVLDVGGGWGELARHMALTRKVKVTSVNVSDAQIGYARTRTAGLSVDTLKCDYRDIQGSFDKIAIIAMMSHVGVKNHRALRLRLARERSQPQLSVDA